MITGIIGCGNIGTELALFMDKRKDFELKYLFDIDKDNSDN
jgi:predicted dinucleotide-utilizing enzyme